MKNKVNVKSEKTVQKYKRKKRIMRFWKNCLLLILLFVLIHLWLKTKSYIFDEKHIVKIGGKYAGQDIQQSSQKIANNLQELYPGHLLPQRHRQWIMYKYAGMVVSMTILHSSLTEYIMIYGSALDTDGYGGHHWLNYTCVVLSGSVKHWEEGTLKANQYGPGENFAVSSGKTVCAGLEANTWVLEYGRGFVPTSTPFIISDLLFSFDVIGIFKLFRALTVAYYYELKSEIASFVASI